ncbi:putative ATP-dependent zinc protease [Vibrio algarum]|uniref:RimK/LysX family protein n=1 Tax=Vibrio algarum TaxID=3020714 RepID=A0ABT4YM23_9VIBR|nr:RimK/LysX family protein [Vibrio sp. KJ40-1]MDB1122485.1 RimK/LysX family protein [Vibrio sp. KJ40-1]
MKKITLSLLTALLLSFCASASENSYTTQNPAYELDGLSVFGRVENVYLTGTDKYKHIPFDGKIDTGADTTSIHADNIHILSSNPKYKGLSDSELLKYIVDEFGGSQSNWWLDEFDTPERDLKLTVIFNVTNPYTGDVLEFEKSLARVSVVRSRTSEEPLYRPVIGLTMKIGDVEIETEASLTDRGNFSTPILIGKTFLKQNAWVFAGYDYLQEQPKATLIGRQETMMVNGLAMDVSISMESKSSVLHATNIKVDKKAKQVSFDTNDNEGNSKSFTLPLIGMIKFGDIERPEVYIPVKGEKHFETKLHVYLRDRSKSSSQLRLGREALSKNFVISASEKNLLDKPKEEFSQRLKDKNPLVVSPEELILVDGIELNAKPDLRVKTPVLKVSSFEISSADKGQQVTYFLQDDVGEQKKFVKPILRKIRVGDTVRPVIRVRLEASGKYSEYDVALETVDNNEQQIFIIGQESKKGGVIINTRTDLLLESHTLVKAGYIENATVEGLNFPVKLDTGADVSSMHAQNIKLYKKEGKDMVDFVYENEQGDKKSFTRQVVRMMTIKAKAGEKANHRPVVKMDVQIGDIRETVKVNLQDRSRFGYSMILGENFLRHGVVVSSDNKFLLGGAEKDIKQ